MNDFLALRVPFLDKHVLTTQSQDKIVSYVNMDDCAAAGLNVAPRSITRNDDGTYEIQELMHPWDSIPSSYTGIAFKVYQGGGFRDCPCVELKASPAKIIQGHMRIPAIAITHFGLIRSPKSSIFSHPYFYPK